LITKNDGATACACTVYAALADPLLVTTIFTGPLSGLGGVRMSICTGLM
jgi:hypothetical protein